MAVVEIYSFESKIFWNNEIQSINTVWRFCHTLFSNAVIGTTKTDKYC
jgi:hypothetical protein